MNDNTAGGSYIELTADIVSAYVSNNSVSASDIPNLINQVHSALMRVSAGQSDAQPEPLKPAISVKKSITPDHLVCLEDGKKFKSLKRHLRTQYNMTPEAVPREMGPAARLPDGGAELCGRALAARQADGPRPAAPPPLEVAERFLTPRSSCDARVERAAGHRCRTFRGGALGSPTIPYCICQSA